MKCALVVLGLLFASQVAVAQDFELRSGSSGHLDLIVRGESFVIPSNVHGLIKTFRDTVPAASFSFEVARERPADVRSAIARRKNVIVSLDYGGLSSGDGKLSSLHLDFVFDENAWRNCKRIEAEFQKLKSEWKEKTTAGMANTWLLVKREAPSLVWSWYLYTGSDLDLTSFPGVTCDSFHECSIIRCIKPGLSVSYYFNDTRIQMPDWKDLISREESLVDQIMKNH